MNGVVLSGKFVCNHSYQAPVRKNERFLIYYAKIMGVSLDTLVGDIEPTYKSTALDNALISEIHKMNKKDKEKLLETIKIWKS